MLRVVAFAAAPAVASVVPLLALPAITARHGAEAWVSLAVAQSVGAAAAVVVELGWGLTGTLRVARQSAANRRRTAALSLITRAVVLLPVVAVVVVLVPALVGPFAGEAVVVAVAAAVGSVNLVWFFIGTGSPGRLLLADALPRTALGVGAAVAVSLADAPVAVYAGAMFAGAVIAVVLGAVVAGVGPTALRGLDARRVLHIVRVQTGAVAARAVSAAYIALPVTLVSLVAPAPVVAVFAAAERLQRMVLTGLQAVPNALQHGVGREIDADERRRAARRALAVNALVGMGAGALFTAGAPLASLLLFSGEATVPVEYAALGGVLIVVVSCSRITGGVMLVNARRIPVIAMSALAGAAVGVPAILVLSSTFGVAGALGGEILAEAAVLAVQWAGLHRAGRGRSLRSGSPDRREMRPVRVAYLRVDDPSYPRNARIREALAAAGAEIVVFGRSRSGPAAVRLLRDAVAIGRSTRGVDVLVVAEFSLAFVPLAWLIARTRGAVLVVDGFVGAYETAVEDWGLARPGSLRAQGYRLVDRVAVAASDLYLVDTTTRAATIRDRYADARVRSVPVGAPSWATPGDDDPHEGVRLLYYGSYLPLHGLPTVVAALALLDGSVSLTLVGEAAHAGGEDDTRADAERLGVLERCSFLPPVAAPALADLIAEHDIVLGVFGGSTKASSVIANKVWQGLACERTVVTRESPALAEIRGLVPAGRLLEVPAGDPAALAARIRGLRTAGPTVGDAPVGEGGGTAARLDAYVAREVSAFLDELAARMRRSSLAGTGGTLS